jgi:hypothetical protein
MSMPDLLREAAPEIRCAHCQTVIHEEDGWWLDEYDDLTCWGDGGEDDLGPHFPRPKGETDDR